MIEDCTAIILAGGQSTRMGRDKANILLGEQTLLQHVIATLRPVFPQLIISVRESRPDLDLLQVIDEPNNAGPLAGLAASLGQIETPWAFVVACDMPFIETALVNLLSQYRAEYQAVVPVIHGHAQPLAAFYTRNVLPKIHRHLAAGGKNSLRALLAHLSVRYVDETELLTADPSLRSFFDLDTPQDLLIARKMS